MSLRAQSYEVASTIQIVVRAHKDDVHLSLILVHVAISVIEHLGDHMLVENTKDMVAASLVHLIPPRVVVIVA